MTVTAAPGPSRFAAIAALSGRTPAGVPAFFERTAQRYGDYATWTIARRRFVLLGRPPDIEDVLVTRAKSFEKGRGFERMARLVGIGLLTANGATHLRRRRLIQPAFHRERIAAYAAVMRAEAQHFAAALPHDAEIEIDAPLRELALRIVTRSLFGGDVDGATSGVIGAALDVAMDLFPSQIGPFGELLEALPFLPMAKRFAHAKATLDAVIGELIARRRAQEAYGDDLLGLLLAANDDDGVLDDTAVRDEALTLYLAGHETTANALTWTFALLAEHPESAAWVRAEVDAVLGAGDVPTLAQTEHLPRTRAAFAEAMRLYPPAWVLGRRAVETVQVGPVQLHRGDVALASQWVTHRDPRYWPDAAAFRPERWLDGTAEAAPPYAYFPFGGGNRKCIGDRFAWAEGIVVTAAVLRRYQLAGGSTAALPRRPLITLRPGCPVRIRCSRRG